MLNTYQDQKHTWKRVERRVKDFMAGVEEAGIPYDRMRMVHCRADCEWAIEKYWAVSIREVRDAMEGA